MWMFIGFLGNLSVVRMIVWTSVKRLWVNKYFYLISSSTFSWLFAFNIFQLFGDLIELWFKMPSLSNVKQVGKVLSGRIKVVNLHWITSEGNI